MAGWASCWERGGWSLGSQEMLESFIVAPGPPSSQGTERCPVKTRRETRRAWFLPPPCPAPNTQGKTVLWGSTGCLSALLRGLTSVHISLRDNALSETKQDSQEPDGFIAKAPVSGAPCFPPDSETQNPRGSKGLPPITHTAASLQSDVHTRAHPRAGAKE